MTMIKTGDLPEEGHEWSITTSDSTEINDCVNLNSDTTIEWTGVDPWNQPYSGDSITIGDSCSSGNIWINPVPSQTVLSGGSFSLQNAMHNKYAVFELPEDDVPEAVYVCGRLVTLGAIGTAVECAFVGDKLIFEPGILNAINYNGRLTVSLKYPEKTYHYNVGEEGVLQFKAGTSIVISELVSTIDHKRKKKSNAKTR